MPLTYEVGGGIMFFAFPFVRSYVRTYIRSSFRHRVKVFALKFIRPHILKTLLWISFIFGAGLGGSVGCAVRLETRRSRVQPPPRSATFFRGD